MGSKKFEAVFCDFDGAWTLQLMPPYNKGKKRRVRNIFMTIFSGMPIVQVSTITCNHKYRKARIEGI
jgi:hypothetical protein